MSEASQSTANLSAAFEAMKKVKWADDYFGSGLVFYLTTLNEDRHFIPAFCLHGEDLAPVQAALHRALETALVRRMQTLQSELNRIDKACPQAKELK